MAQIRANGVDEIQHNIPFKHRDITQHTQHLLRWVMLYNFLNLTLGFEPAYKIRQEKNVVQDVESHAVEIQHKSWKHRA